MQRTTSVTLGDELQGLVDGWVSSGRYGSVSEVVRAALRTLQEREARVRSMWARWESLPVEPPDEEDLQSLARIEEARAKGELDGPGLTTAELRQQLEREAAEEKVRRS